MENISYKTNFIFLNHFFTLFDKIEQEGLWAVSEWEIKEPPMNQAYIALSVHSWLTYGLTVILLKYQHLINLNQNLAKINLNQRFKFLFDDIKKILDSINIEDQDNKNYINSNLINHNYDEEFIFRKEKILNIFSFLKKEIEIDYYKKIREIPLSSEKVEEFRNNVGKLWEQNCLTINLLKHFDKVEYIPNVEDVLGYGFFQRLLKMKFAFIEGELYQNVFGLSDFGSKLARNIDTTFFNRLNKNIVVSANNERDIVSNFIKKIENKNNLVIFANWRNADKLGNIIYNNENQNSILNRTFNGIPVLNQFSKSKDDILIIDFSLVKVQIYTSDNPNWYKKQLLVEITESQKDDLTENLLKEWNEKDGYNYNIDEVDILESNNVNAKILLKYNFVIPEETKYLIISTK